MERLAICLLVIFYFAGARADAQQASASATEAQEYAALPDDPSAALEQQTDRNQAGAPAGSGAAANASTNTGKQTKRILFIVPNFRAVSADQHLPPQTVKDKFKTATLDSFDYSSFIFVGMQAGIAQARNSYPEFRQGAVGYGRYYWHTFADTVNENLWVEFLIPAALHEDTRYYTLGRGNAAKRLGYSFSRIAITRSDGGGETFNAAEIVGAGAAAGISGLYYPSRERTFTKTYQKWATNLLIDGGTFVFKEFWPNINNTFFHQKD